MTERVEIEKLIIGHLTCSPDAIVDFYDFLLPESFNNSFCRSVYEECKKMYDAGQQIDVGVIAEKIHDKVSLTTTKTMEIIVECYADVTITIESGIYLNKCYLAERSAEILKNANGSNIDEKMKQIKALEEKVLIPTKEKINGESLADEFENAFFCEKDLSKMILTGFQSLDNLILINPGDTVLIGARTRIGKSALLTHIAINMLKAGKKVLFFNCEMPRNQVVVRILANLSGIPTNDIMRATRFPNKNIEKEYRNAINTIRGWGDNFILLSNRSLPDIRLTVKAEKPDVVVIDYIQLLEATVTYKNQRSAEVGDISKKLKVLAMDLEVPIICAAQLNREGAGTDKKPVIENLRESGDLEQDGSIIILMSGEGKDKTISVEKNRNGKCGESEFIFDGDIMRFYDKHELNETNEQIPF